jgi:MBG domain (YGX type)/Bacterial Ig-like domain (group 3)
MKRDQTCGGVKLKSKVLRSLISVSILLCGLFVTSVISASPSFSATCAQGGPCALGDTGPGGGTVFYYKASGFNCGPSFADTCHYLEVAPSGWQNSILSGYGSDGMFSWSNGTPRLMVPAAITGISTTVNIASSTLGLGYQYTQAEVTQDNAYYSFPASPYAPNTSRAYAGGTKSDWYLPMPSELNQLCKYVRGQLWVSDDTLCNSTGTLTLGFQNGPYYSAYPAKTGSDPNIYQVWSQAFNTGNFAQVGKDNAAYVRPIRAFTLPSVPSTTVLAASSSSPTFGQSLTLTATVKDGAATATGAMGTVDFKNNGTSISGCATSAISSGISQCTFTPASAITYSNLTATYSGGPGYGGSSASAISITVSKATPTFSWSALNKTYGDSSFTLTSPTSGTPGSWTYTSGNSAVISLSGSTASVGVFGTAFITGTFTPSDTGNYVSGGTATMTITVGKANPALSWSGVTQSYGQTSLISPPTANTAGTFTYSSGTPSVVSISADSATVIGLGSSLITATFTPSDTTNYLSGGTTSMTITAARAAITVTPTSGQSKVYGANNPTISYSITSGVLIGSDVLSGALTYTGSNVGAYPITIGSLANSNYTITLASVNFAITQATQSAVTLSSLSSAYNPSNKTVALTGSGGSGTGSYTYALDASNTTPGCSVSGSTLTYTTAGTCVIAVTRTSDTNYLARTDVVSFSIGLATQTITFNSLSAKSYSSDTFTVTATSSSSLTVVFTSGSPTICTTSGSNGSTITLLGVGTCVINANQAGDSNTSAASQVSQNFIVNPRAITITADAKTKIYGATDPTLTYAITTGSLLLGDALTGTLTRASGSDVGTYQIQQGTLTTSNNPKYAITYASANLSITRATPTLVLTYPNSNVAILRPGAVDTPTVTTSSSSGSLTFATTAASSICTVDATSGVISLFGAGSCAVVMSTTQTTNYIQYSETTTVTVALLSTSLTGIDQSKLVSMGQPFYAHASIDQSYSFSSGSNGASVAIPAGTLDATVPISISLLTDSTSQRALISSDGTSVLSVVVSWVGSDGSVPSTNTGKAISVTLTNPSIKNGAKIYSIIGSQSQLLGTSTSDGSVTTLITDDPVLLVINPVVTTPAPSSSGGGGGGYIMSVAVDNTAAIIAANDKLAADKAAAELKAAADKAVATAAEAAALKAAKDLADAQAQAAAELKASQDKAAEELRIAEELRLAKLKAEAELKAAAEKKALLDFATASSNANAAVTLYSVSTSLKLNSYDTAYLAKYVKSLKNGASVTCIGYAYGKSPASKASQTLAKRQATAVCSQMKKTNKTLKTSIVIYPATKAPKAAVGAKWVGVSYRIDGFKAKP